MTFIEKMDKQKIFIYQPLELQHSNFQLRLN